MTKLVTISGKEMCKLLEKRGFEKIYGKAVMLDSSILMAEEPLFRSVTMKI